MFSGLEVYRLKDIKVKRESDSGEDPKPIILGRGSYGTVQELEYVGLKCAGKKIHDILSVEDSKSDNYIVLRFQEECKILSKLRHPNIVQFLGVHFQSREGLPLLVMEFLPMNLTSVTEKYGILQQEISFSILHDVALGLHYLHSQASPIIHRDLTSNNILLTSNMTAKISDLGMAKVLDLNPLQISRMTQNPGTPAYMPPEVMVAKPLYDVSVDEFSYGILMIHVFSGKWPEPQIGKTIIEGNNIIGVSEADRRKIFLEAIGDDHPLMSLIKKCIRDNPKGRAHTSEIIQEVSKVKEKYPVSTLSQIDMLQKIADNESENRHLREDTEKDLQLKQEQLLTLETKLKEKEKEIERLQILLSSEVEHLKLQLKDLNSQHVLLKTEKDAEIEELNADITLKETQSENSLKALLHEREQFDIQLANDRSKHEEELEREREANQRVTNEKKDLISEVMAANSQIIHLQRKIATLESDIAGIVSRKYAVVKRKDAELEAKTGVLQEKNTIITGLSEQLNKTREFLANKQQEVLQGVLKWKQYPSLPTVSSKGNATVISDKVYYGGGHSGDEVTVHCYDPRHGRWASLPPLPVKRFGLGQVDGKLVAVGGKKKRDDRETNEVYTYDDRSQRWRQTIPPMPTARWLPGVVSFRSALVIAGGAVPSAFYTTPSLYSNVVEIFRPDTSQWYRANQLPVGGCDLSFVACGNICYALGGYSQSARLNQVLCATLNDLLRSAVPVNQATLYRTNSDTQSAWKMLRNTISFQPAAGVLTDELLCIGGNEKTEGFGGNDMNRVYMYSPSINSWIYISDLPVPCSNTAVAVVSPTEILVIGGLCGGDRVNTVYKATLTLKA